ncbi:hypothetical protein [Xanthomonas sp. SI]|uniref:hypothetical protein n=1 Tax=Xanthomonas sp. SI TaxID=2724123 RepID=UPI00163A1CD5|nr:hypothetical protein [Xanthomonas sp. SI]QNH10621.1 hypothetical protein HEP75_00024 [Xanthomonas sp. SI]
MNWSKVFKYAGVLLVVQFALGLAEGFFLPESTTNIAFLLLDAAVSFSVCAGIFAHLSARQPVKPFAHAWAALFLQAALAALFALALKRWLGTPPPLLLALDWLVLVCALLAGSALGSNLLRVAKQRADA